jgi:hypothetical protein
MSESNRSEAADPLSREPRPGVWTWFVVYCVAMTLLALIVIGISLIVLLADPAEMYGPKPATLEMALLLVAGICMIAVFGAAPFLPRRPWSWVYHLILIVLGMPGCFLPACVALMLSWVKPETRRYFGREDA